MNFEKNYTEQIGNVRFRENFEIETVELMKQAANGKEENNMKNRKPIKILAAAVLIIAILSVTAFAVSYLLSASDVAKRLGETYAAESFGMQKNAIQSVTDKGYTVSFLGVAEGKKFINNESIDVEAECSYFVVSVAKEDGSALSLYEGNPLGMSIIIEGCPAWKVNTWSLDSRASGFEENGVLYYLYECMSLEIFADRNVFLAVYEGMVPSPEIIVINDNGAFEFAEGYNGFKAMFRLPLDPEKADPYTADKIISALLPDADESFSRTAE